MNLNKFQAYSIINKQYTIILAQSIHPPKRSNPMKTFGTTEAPLKQMKMRSDGTHMSWQLDDERVLCIESAPENYPKCVYRTDKNRDYLKNIEELLAD